MDPLERKKVTVITKYAEDSFHENDWRALGQITGHLDKIINHPRLFRSMSFGDDDYGTCAAEVLDQIFSADSSTISDVIEHFDIDLWYQQKEPQRYERIFQTPAVRSADFWEDGFLKVFLSHLSSSRSKMAAMKSNFFSWGISAFVAHQDIEPSALRTNPNVSVAVRAICAAG